jgi:hypothetical protein
VSEEVREREGVSVTICFPIFLSSFLSLALADYNFSFAIVTAADDDSVEIDGPMERIIIFTCFSSLALVFLCDQNKKSL